MNNQFTISSRTVYTIKSVHGNIECEGLKGLEDHVEALLGAFIDRMHSEHTGNFLGDKIKDHSYITKNVDDLKVILSLRDAVEDLKNPESDCECNDNE